MIDWSKLSRDYRKEPLKRGERLSREEIEYLYLDCNLNFIQIGEICGTNWKLASNNVKMYDIEKSKEMKAESQRNYFLETKGVTNPAQTKEAIEKKKQTMLERYGVDNPNKCKEIREKGKKTCLERYGVENPAQLKEIQDKMRKTMQERYGVNHSSQAQEIKDKKQKTMQERYGCNVPIQNLEVKKKIQQTCLKRYGTTNPFQAKKCQEKQQQTLQERYGVSNSFQILMAKEKHKQTCLERYGVEYINQNPCIREKGKKTCLERYGVQNPSQVEEVKKKKVQTCLMNYGVENPNQSLEVQLKSYNTKKQRGTFGTSSDEHRIEELLRLRFEIIETQYSEDPRYPYPADFYVPKLDLFIEYQGFMTHGNEPYNPNNLKHQELVKLYQKRSKEIGIKGEEKSLYKAAIKTWTIKDPEKREIARKNKLNWMEFFTMEQFVQWYNSIGENND